MRIILATISLFFAIAFSDSLQKDELDVIIQKYIEVQQKYIHSLIKKHAVGEDNENNRIQDSFEFSIQIPSPEIDYDLFENDGNTVIRQWMRPSRRPWGWWTTTVPTTESLTISSTIKSTTSRTTRLTTRRTRRTRTPRSTISTTKRTTRTTTPRSTTIRTSRSTTRKRTTSRKTTQKPESTQTQTNNQDATTSKKTSYTYSRPTSSIRTTTKRRTTTISNPSEEVIYDYVNFYDWVTKE